MAHQKKSFSLVYQHDSHVPLKYPYIRIIRIEQHSTWGFQHQRIQKIATELQTPRQLGEVPVDSDFLGETASVSPRGPILADSLPDGRWSWVPIGTRFRARPLSPVLTQSHKSEIHPSRDSNRGPPHGESIIGTGWAKWPLGRVGKVPDSNSVYSCICTCTCSLPFCC